MFYKKALFYSLTQALVIDNDFLEHELRVHGAREPGKQDFATLGFVPVIPDTQMYHLVTGDWVTMKLCREERILPMSVVNDAVAKRVKEIEADTGDYVSKKRLADIKESVITHMLPTSHTKKTYIVGAINTKLNLIVVDGTHKKAETWLAMVRKAITSLPVVPLFRFSLQDRLTHWLKDTPDSIELLEEAKLKSTDDLGTITSFKSQPLDADAVTVTVDNGSLVQEIGIQFTDNFTAVFCEDGSIKRLKFSDRLKEESDDIPKDQVKARIDADTLLNLSALEEFAAFCKGYFNLNEQ